MINFLKKKKKVYWNSAYLEPELQPLTLATCVVSKELSLFLSLWVGGQAAAGAQWESLAPAGSSLDLPGSSTTPRNWHLWGQGPLDRWHLKPLMTCTCKGLGPVRWMAVSSFRSPSIW